MMEPQKYQMENRKKDVSGPILVVDDDALFRKILRAGLEEKGYAIVEAENGKQGYDMLKSRPFDLVFMDLLMPEMNGFELLELMKADKILYHVPVIVISTEDDMEGIARCIETGATDYLFKPLDPLILHARVNASLAAKKLHDQEQESLRKIQKQRSIAEAANKKVMDSIFYAEKIQRSLLPNLREVQRIVPDSFFLWMPRDIVGGDIYFAVPFDDECIIAVIDCTGHGVPGAFMTMIAISALNRIVKDEGCHDLPEILKRLNRIVKTTLQQDKEYAVSDDGMDVGMVRILLNRNPSGPSRCFASYLVFAGARISLYCVCNGETTIVKGDRHSIGYRSSDPNVNFTGHEIKIEKGMTFYMTTDGFTDQVGGEKRLPFGRKRFMELLDQIDETPVIRQKELFLEAFETYKGENDSVDDMTMVGFGF